jgi:hypothetical protein
LIVGLVDLYIGEGSYLAVVAIIVIITFIATLVSGTGFTGG